MASAKRKPPFRRIEDGQGSRLVALGPYALKLFVWLLTNAQVKPVAKTFGAFKVAIEHGQVLATDREVEEATGLSRRSLKGLRQELGPDGAKLITWTPAWPHEAAKTRYSLAEPALWLPGSAADTTAVEEAGACGAQNAPQNPQTDLFCGAQNAPQTDGSVVSSVRHRQESVAHAVVSSVPHSNSVARKKAELKALAAVSQVKSVSAREAGNGSAPAAARRSGLVGQDLQDVAQSILAHWTIAGVLTGQDQLPLLQKPLPEGKELNEPLFVRSVLVPFADACTPADIVADAQASGKPYAAMLAASAWWKRVVIRLHNHPYLGHGLSRGKRVAEVMSLRRFAGGLGGDRTAFVRKLLGGEHEDFDLALAVPAGHVGPNGAQLQAGT